MRNVIALCILLLIVSGAFADAPEMKKGILDLTGYDLEREPVTIRGESEFYWHQLLSPGDFPLAGEKNKRYVPLPGMWNGFSVDEFTNLSPTGYGTYRFKVIIRDSGTHLSFRIPVINTAVNMFINGEKIFHSGAPAKTKAEYVPAIKPGIVNYIATDDTLEIIFQVSNYDAKYGGFLGTIKMGQSDALRQAHNRRIFLDFFLSGALFIMSIYFISLFVFHRRESWHLYFGILCFSGMAVIATSGEYVLTYLPQLRYDILARIDFVSFFGAVPLLTLYIRKLFEKEYNKRIAQSAVVISVIAVLVAIFAPLSLTKYLVEPFLFFTIVLLAYKLVIVTIATRKGKRGGFLFLLGFAVLTAAILHDVLMNLNYVVNTPMIGIGIFVFLILQTYLLSDRFVRTMKKNELLTHDLNEINKNLEKEVQLRTEKLNRSIEQLKAAQKELNRSNKELMNVNATKNKYLSIIGHDLRGPVSGIKTALELLIEEIENGEIDQNELKETLTALYESSASTYDLLVNLFQWARSQMGNIKYNPQDINLKETVDESLRVLKENIDGKKISVRTIIPANIDLHADPNMVSTIIRNLISNAVKFTLPGGMITIEAEEAGRMAEISIADTGVGIPAEKLPYIFEYAANKSTRGTKQEKGTGIGLILVKEFVDRNDGKISVHSNEGKGTVFVFTLPLKK